MEEEGCHDRGDEALAEEEPLLRPPTYLNFRLGRETQRNRRRTGFVQPAFKVCFCSLGLWGHRAWSYIPRVFVSAVCICQAVFEFETEKKYQGFYELSSTAAVLSCLVFIGCFMVAKRKDSNLVPPSQTMMEDIHTMELFFLFFAFVFIYVIPSLLVFIFFLRMPENNEIFITTGVVAVFLAHWASVNTCNVFAVSSFALGK